MDGSADIRPAIGKLRRRSTLNWTNAHPRVRQKKLEDVTGGRMADTWFSLHCSEGEEPIYVSETINKAMNPSFRFFDLNTYGPAVSRREDLTIKLWARTEKMEDFMLLIERQLSLRSLQFIGKSVRSCNAHISLPIQKLTTYSLRTSTIPYRRTAFSSTCPMASTPASQIFPWTNCPIPHPSNHQSYPPKASSQPPPLMP